MTGQTLPQPKEDASKTVPGCGLCAEFEDCVKVKNVRADTDYCQWWKNRFKAKRAV